MAHAEGPKADAGEVQRFLAELPWSPFSILNNSRLRFRELEGGDVQVWVEGLESATVDLLFDSHGDIVGARAIRPKDEALTPWEGSFYEYKEFQGIRVPSGGEVAWLLPETGSWTDWKGHVDSYEVENLS